VRCPEASWQVDLRFCDIPARVADFCSAKLPPRHNPVERRTPKAVGLIVCPIHSSYEEDVVASMIVTMT
jgi:hypothetical protein